jgi:DNA repair exonuclease SbcCD ATPase subunit
MLDAALARSWSGRVQAAREAATRKRAIRDQIARDLHARIDEVAALTLKTEKLAKVGELLRLLVDRLVSEQRKVVEGLVSEGLQTVFHDQDLGFEADVTQRAGRVEIDLFLRRGNDATAVRGHPLESFGGGPTSITALILRVLVLRRLGRKPILLLDETLAAVSDEYVDATGRLLQRICASMGIDVVLVTHKQAFLEHADVAYQGTEESNESGTRLGVRKLRGKR